nr:uncharacterized protein LOC111420521 [Onthophagus taurus]
MFNKFIFLLLATIINSSCVTKPYYWRIYEDCIPNDAVSTEDENSEIFVGRVGVCYDNKVVSYYPATFNSTSKSATTDVLNKKRVFNKDIMILCTSEPERLRWKYINNVAVQGDLLNKIVAAGEHPSGIRYVGKVFHENEWKVSTVYKYGHNNPGLYIWTNVDGSEVIVKDFQVLTYESS